MPELAQSLIGTVLDRRYRLDAVIGRGSMGVVYRATHVAIDKAMAVKVLRDVAGALLPRFLKEARLASKIDHPNVVDLSDCGELPGGGAYFVMELLQGESLAAAIRRERRIDPPRALRIAREVLSGLTAAHAAGVIHRDLKPENVFLAAMDKPPGETVKLLDFGVAHLDGSTDTTPGSVFGTPEYMSPEQARGEQVDVRSDLYGVGVLLFEMLAGRVPIHAAELVDLIRNKLRDDAPRLFDVAPELGLPLELDSLVASLLEIERDDRPTSAAEVIRYLDGLPAEPVAPDASARHGRATIDLGSGSAEPPPAAATSIKPSAWRPPKREGAVGPSAHRGDGDGRRPVLPPGVTLRDSVPAQTGRTVKPGDPAPAASRSERTTVSVIRAHGGAHGGAPASSWASGLAPRVPPSEASRLAAIPHCAPPNPARMPPRAKAAGRPSIPDPNAVRVRAGGSRPRHSGRHPTARPSYGASILVAMVAAAITAAAVTLGVAQVVPRDAAAPAEAARPAPRDVGATPTPTPRRPPSPPAAAPTPDPPAADAAPAVGHRTDTPPPKLDRQPALARSEGASAERAVPTPTPPRPRRNPKREPISPSAPAPAPQPSPRPSATPTQPPPSPPVAEASPGGSHPPPAHPDPQGSDELKDPFLGN